MSLQFIFSMFLKTFDCFEPIKRVNQFHRVKEKLCKKPGRTLGTDVTSNVSETLTIILLSGYRSFLFKGFLSCQVCEYVCIVYMMLITAEIVFVRSRHSFRQCQCVRYTMVSHICDRYSHGRTTRSNPRPTTYERMA